MIEQKARYELGLIKKGECICVMNGKTKSLDTRIWYYSCSWESERFGTTNKLYIKVK